MKKRILAIILSICLIIASIAAINFTATAAKQTAVPVAAESDLQDTAASYGLAKKVEDGNILHCFNWTLNQIKEELPNIAAAGFTSVQTSPLQNHTGWGGWYWLYQPTSFNIGNEIGSYNDLKSLCSEADKYGIKVIVDVVANHMAGYNDGTWSGDLDGSMRNSDYFHNMGGCDNWDNRYDVTHKNIGMPDLNTENYEVQNKILGLVSSYKSAGVDGIRWDAAKHIGLPSEGCELWRRVSEMGLYNYGEILDSPAGSSDAGYNSNLMCEYSSFIGVTDATFSGTITGAIRDNKVTDSTGNWINRGVSASRVVYWAESHDTFCNNGWTNGLSEYVIDKAYAIVGARAYSQSLYLSRPYEHNHESISTAKKGSTHYTSKQVAAVNHFHNAMVGTREVFTTGSGCYVICREGGAVIVAASGGDFDVTVPNGGGIVQQGTYTDEVAGGTWTVDASSIRGHLGGPGIAVIYNQPAAGPSVSANPGTTTYKTDTLSVTLSYSNATSGSYSIDGGSYKSFSNGQKITIGAGKSYGTVTTLTVKASNGSVTEQQSYTYTKVDPNAVQTVWFDNSSYNWSRVYCYLYGDNGSVSDWPGVEMRKTSDNLYYYEIPRGYENGRVLFTEDRDSSDHRYPGADQPGLELNGNSMMFGRDHSWTTYTDTTPTQPTQPTPTQPTPTQPTPTQPTPTQPPQTDPPVTGESYMIGDADQDNNITILDATAIQRHLASIRKLTGKALKAADADSDKQVSVLDATAIQRYLTKLKTSPYIGSYVGSGDPETPTEPPVDPTTPLSSNSVRLDASATSALPEVWYAWTWNDGEGRWVKGSGSASSVIFTNLDSHIIFVRANPDMEIGWNNGSVWNQTGDLNTQLGKTFTTTGWSANRINGDWN